MISISPLLKKLVAHSLIEELEITTARESLPKNSADLQPRHCLLIGLLKAHGYSLNANESRMLDDMLDDEEQLTSDGMPAVSIASLLKLLIHKGRVQPDSIAVAVAFIFDNKLSTSQCALLLGLLAYTGYDKNPQVLAKTGRTMRAAADQIDRQALRTAVGNASRAFGRYEGGLCDIVGTGGDGYSTFNVSTTASIVASSILLLSKHGNRASSSTSGSADLLQAIQPKGPIIEAITAQTLPKLYGKSSYAFLFAPIFHPGMGFVGGIRKDLGIRTIFNVLGPLANPAEGLIEARIVGIAEQRMGPIFAEALSLTGAEKVMVVCGAENLDEISCAGRTNCWNVVNGKASPKIETFEVEPADFGLCRHPLSDVAGGKSPPENAKILVDLLENRLNADHPILDFVLLNTAALLAVSGACEDPIEALQDGDPDVVIKERGPGGQRWKEGVRLARKAIESGRALDSLRKYIEATHSLQMR